MATGNWIFYNKMKEVCFTSAIDFDTSLFRIHLYRSGTNASLLALSAKSSITSELTATVRYTQSGITLTNPTLAQSGTVVSWDIDDITLTADVDWSDLRFAMIEHSDIPICHVEMSTVGFNVTTGNTLTIQQNVSGLFEMSGGTT